LPLLGQKCYCAVMKTVIPMPSKFLVRHISLNKFLSPAGRWVKRAEAACHFPNLLNAINTCLARGLKDVELILRFDGDTPDYRVPLDTIQ
jgi:hypothetical protein